MHTTFANKKIINAKPFLKWAGGKTQLLEELNKRLPEHILKEGIIDCYVEPFVGGGAMFFYLKSKYEVKKSYLFDINPELIVGYKTIKKSPKSLVKELRDLENKYLNANGKREEFFYEIRGLFNIQSKKFNYNRFSKEWVIRTSYLIFLNKTCFNGLFRQNRIGDFNVPYGKYRNPTICDEENIIEVSKVLKDTKIILGDFTKSEEMIEKGTLVYLDPPYRPLSTTSSFTSYAKEGFSDEDQKRLAKFYKKMDEKGAYLLLSNSDPKNENPKDSFFDDLYTKYKIERVSAKRFINCDATKRGKINELVITNRSIRDNYAI